MLQSVYKKKRVDITVNLDTNKSSVFLMYYRLILVTKYRKRVINKDVSEYAQSIFLT